jgi:hypothetical protein
MSPRDTLDRLRRELDLVWRAKVFDSTLAARLYAEIEMALRSARQSGSLVTTNSAPADWRREAGRRGGLVAAKRRRTGEHPR